MRKVNCYTCEKLHNTFTVEPIVEGWSAPAEITCSQCFRKAKSCQHPDGIQDEAEKAVFEFFMVNNRKELVETLDKLRPREIYSIRWVNNFLELLEKQKTFFYKRIK
jgi:hypothetical protein